MFDPVFQDILNTASRDWMFPLMGFHVALELLCGPGKMDGLASFIILMYKKRVNAESIGRI